MPRYDYRRTNCGEEFVFSHSWKELREQCPACDKNTLKKIISTVRIRRFNNLPPEDSKTRVHNAIEEARKDLKSEKTNLRKRKK